MLVVDIDSHFMEPPDWLSVRFPELASQLPELDHAETLADLIFGDLWGSAPPTVRPDPRELIPEGYRPMLEQLTNASPGERDAVLRTDAAEAMTMTYTAFGSHGGDDRVAWLDEKGIDFEFVVPFGGVSHYRNALRSGNRPLGLAALQAGNTWIAEAIGTHTDRMSPVALVDIADIDWSIAEMTRMRELGSYMFQVKGEPAGDKSLAHPDYDRVWAAATDLGMMALLHVGGGRAVFSPGWFNDGGGNSRGLALFASTQYQQIPEVTLAALIFGGVFERHPKLTFVVAELGIGWIPYWLHRIDEFFDDPVLEMLMAGDYRLALKPGEYARRNVRVTPQPLVSQPPAEVIERAGPDMIVFSSDYPHPEGSKDPVDHYEQALAGLDERTRARFFGESMAEVLASLDCDVERIRRGRGAVTR